MAEKLIGSAKFSIHGNDMFWDYFEIARDGNGNYIKDADGRMAFLKLHWSGYNDDAWWRKWSKQDRCDTRISDVTGKSYRIDFHTCEVFEQG